MPRGGKRDNAGRRKAERPTNANVAQKVLNEQKAERLWCSIIELEKRRLGISEAGNLLASEDNKNVSIIPLTNVLRYLEDRAYGRPVDTVNHLHDKPIEMNVNVSMAEIIREVRHRKQEYERSSRN